MSNSADVTLLRQMLVGEYDDLRRRLTRRLGSEDVASDVLQETYLHLERSSLMSVIESPKRYLLTIATNIARMRFRRERRLTSLSELDEALGFVDEAPDPLSSLEARQELEALKAAFDELSPRRRYILFASRLEARKLREIADELAVSQRLVEKELKAALMFCGAKVSRDVIRRFGPGAREASSLEVLPVAAIREDRHDDAE
ncbi:sigma-70 family RNA polymerase sigma factor [Tardiphaga sp. 42S5]|uniref:RNA polymerase sigma factor n=1 Tax=Tardiphaga sp. 42S5 TaxID=1404799 RepID=UPI002A5A8B48|nr:sigma-70 family RNA polymerase sigma factor [Tardiphaga sp. 42S5]WPO40256.1 sigma-70 family RNA polymerase sigma factor [Tardiphaga sp. 42S5]